MTASSWQRLYIHRPDLYEQLVDHEDVAGWLLPALQALHPLRDATVVEFGAGTGRITAQIAPLANRVWAFDLTAAMLGVAQQKRPSQANWTLVQADSRAMPLPARCADVAIEGWSFLQIATWHLDAWQHHLDLALNEMQRVLRPGGSAVLIETLGTGETEPNPPARFTAVYDHFERVRGFTRRWIRTDYRFASRAAAAAIVAPCFGDAMLDRLIARPDGVFLPECTGIWWRQARPATESLP